MPNTNAYSPVRTAIILLLIGFIILFPAGSALATGDADLIFVQVPVSAQPSDRNAHKISSARDPYVADVHIAHLPPGAGSPVNLTDDFFAACDPDISFDGNYILFAGKKSAEDFWQIWQMRIDGSELTRITNAKSNCMMPVYAGNRFYLDDPQPTPQIIYAAEVPGWTNPIESGSVTALYGTDHQGKTTYRLTFNIFSDFSPDVLPNGRIVFSSRQPTGGGRLALMAVNNDGTDLMPYYGNHESPVYKEMVHISDTDKRVYYIESDTLRWLGGGSIAEISQSRPLHSRRTVTVPEQGIYHSPCPLPGGELIASFRQNGSGTFGLYQIDPANGKIHSTIYANTEWHAIDAQLLAGHPVAQGRSNWLIPGSTTGVFYCLDSYRSDLPEGENIEKGMIRFVRVLEGLPGNTLAAPDTEVREPKTPDLVPRRILGTIPVEKDGSFQVKVPAHTPVNFQLLDQDYVMIREQKGWTWVIGNENRGCIGCHENREFSPPNKMVQAVMQPAHDLTGSAKTGQVIDFRHDIAPLLVKSCAGSDCHSSGQHDRLILFSGNDTDLNLSVKSYQNLMAAHQDQAYIYPGSAQMSLLTNIMRTNSGPAAGKRHHVPVNLTDDEKRLVIEWIDLGAQWDLGHFREQSVISNNKSGKK